MEERDTMSKTLNRYKVEDAEQRQRFSCICLSSPVRSAGQQKKIKKILKPEKKQQRHQEEKEEEMYVPCISIHSLEWWS